MVDSAVAAQPNWAPYVDDPLKLATATTIEAFSIPSEGIRAIHLAGLKRRFNDLRSKISTLDRLATEQGVTAMESLTDVVPLLFPHTFYKSYAYSHLNKGRYDRLNAWLQELTSCDLSGVDLNGCDTLEGWMERIEAASPIQCLTTSGTSGKISFVPRTRGEWPRSVLSFFIQFHQGFHGEPNQDLCVEDLREVPILFPNFRHGRHTQHRIVDHLVKLAYGGDESMVMALYPDRMDLDVLLLAGRIGAAEAEGKALDVPPRLLAMRDVFAEQRRRMPELQETFFERVIAQHAGKRITTFCTWASLFDAAVRARDTGHTHVFRSDSLIVTGGGMKGRTLPSDWYRTVCDFIGMDEIRDGYGCSEQHFAAAQCPHHHYHIHPLNIPFVLNPETGDAFPSSGTHKGRFAFFDLAAETYWGGFITGDEVTIHWDEDCPCGRKGPYLDKGIQRYSEKQGGDDKINCAGVPQAHQRAIDVIANM